jgi:hypothetical protein
MGMSEEVLESAAADVSASTDTLGADASDSLSTPEAPSQLEAQWDSVLADETARNEPSESPAPDAVATGERPAAPAGSSQAAPQHAPQAQWTQQDFQYAQALGVSQRDLQRIGDPNVFRSMVNRFGELMQRQAAPTQTPQTPAQQYQGFQPYKLPGDEELYDEGIRGAIGHFNQHLQGVHAHYEQRFQQLAPVLNQFQQHLPYLAQMQQSAQQAAQQAFYDQFDAALDGLDETIVGRGKVSALSDASQKEARRQVAQQVEKEIAYHRSRGDAMPPLDQMAKRAFHGLFFDRLTQQQKVMVQGRVADRMRQTTASPARKAVTASAQSRLDAQWDQVLSNR